MYEGLYDTRKGLSPRDSEVIGAMTARLIFPWDQWIHRRVDRVTFSDEDALCRDVSVDFTIPYWFHHMRRTPQQQRRRQLVPLGFLRKGAQINFTLQDRNYASLPLLSAPQNAQVAEAVLRYLAERALNGSVPHQIIADMSSVVRERPEEAEGAYRSLFTARDPVSQQRAALATDRMFANTAVLFRDSFLALSMISLARHERAVVHFSLEEQLFNVGGVRQVLGQVLGSPRIVTVGVSSPNEAASYHLEIEAPDGLMITEAVSFQHTRGGPTIKRNQSASVLRRAHCHFSYVPPRSSAGAYISLQPRRSTVIRAATLTALLTLASTIAIGARFAHIESEDNAAAAALLLAVTGIVGLIVVRSNENEMATTLLFPLRVLAVIPAMLGVLAAIIVVVDPAPVIGYVCLGLIAALITVITLLLVRHWRKIREAMARRN
jgi:hypothetical protein